MKSSKTSKGFSLIELIIVIAIIGILAAVVIPQMIGTTEKAHAANVAAVEGALKSAVEMAYSAALAEGSGHYLAPEKTADHAGGGDVELIDFLLKSYDPKWTVKDCDFDFPAKGGVNPGPTVNAVAFIYDIGESHEERIYYAATNAGGVSAESIETGLLTHAWWARVKGPSFTGEKDRADD